MPTLNSRGQAAMGQAGGPGSVDRRVLLDPGGELCWVTDDLLIGNTGSDAAGWQVVAINLTGAWIPLAPGANTLCAGGGRWLGWADPAKGGAGLFGSITHPAAGPRGAGPDGTLAYCRDYQSGRGLVLQAPDGTETEAPADIYALDVQVLGPTSALWNDGHDHTEVLGRAPVRPALPSWRLRLVTVDSVDYLIYWSEGTGLVVQVDGAADGWILEPRPIAFNHGAREVNGALVVTWSTTSGEGPNDLVTVTVDRTQPRVPLVPSVQVPAIGRPLWVGPFYFGAGKVAFPGNCTLPVVQGAPRLLLTSRAGDVLAAYVAGNPDGDVDALERAIAASQQLGPEPVLAYWTAAAQRGRLPHGAAIVGVEAYRHVDESLAVFETRVAAAVARIADRAFLIAQCYSSNANNTADLVSLVPIYARLARAHATIEGILVFSAGARASGWDDHPEVRDAWRRLTEGIAGTPAVPPASDPGPTAPPPPPPHSPPVDPPGPPAASRFALAKEVTMSEPTRVALRLGQYFASVDPAEMGTRLYGFGPLRFKKETARTDPHAAFTMTPIGSNKFLVRPESVPTGAVSIDATEFSGEIAEEFGIKPNVADGDVGPDSYEALSGWTLGVTGVVILLVHYNRNGEQYESACLTMVKL
jgi:hypothetical protein